MPHILSRLAVTALACPSPAAALVDAAAVADSAAMDVATAETLPDAEVDGTDALPDALVDAVADSSAVDVPQEVTAACGWVAMPAMSTPRESFNAAWGADVLEFHDTAP